MHKKVVNLDEMLKACSQSEDGLHGVIIDVKDIVFEERVKMNCFYCGKYNNGWRCPPKIPNIDVVKMLDEFDNSAFIYVKKPFNEEDYESVRGGSALELHKAMLACEKYLWNKNNSTALSFIAGSCRLCKNGCAPNKCANPYMSRSPVEALGINVVKTAQKYGINISFPPQGSIMRIGLLLW